MTTDTFFRTLALTCLTMTLAIALAMSATAEASSGDDAAAQQKMMAEMMKLGAPGEHHKTLDAYAGSWDVKITMWMSPDAPPQTSAGTSEVKWILDGRFLQEHFSSEMEMGGETHAYEGLGIIGYDNVEKEYVSMWADNMTTALMIFDDGEYDAATKTLTLEGEYDDPMLGVEVEMTIISRVVSDDEIHFEMHKDPEGGEDHKCFEMVYTRQK